MELLVDAKIIETEVMQDLPSKFFKKSHKLVFSQLSLSPVEHDIFALFLTRLNKEQWQSYLNKETIECPKYTFSNEVLSDWFGVSSKQLFRVLKAPSRRLAGKSVGIMNDHKESFKYLPLFKRVQYEDGELLLIPNDELLNEYLGVSHGHSQIPHKTFRNLKKEYSKRLYSILCRFKDPRKTELHYLSLHELYSYFGLLNERGQLVKQTYAKVNNLIERIIKPSIAEIDEKEPFIHFLTDEKSGHYGYSCKKKGRRISEIKFLYRWSSPVAHQQLDVQHTNAFNRNPYDLAFETYHTLLSSDEKSGLNITQEQLNNLTLNMPLLQKNIDFDDTFFQKYLWAQQIIIQQQAMQE